LVILTKLTKLQTGFYEPFRVKFNELAGIDTEKHVPFTSVAAGAVSGAVGGNSLVPGPVSPLLKYELSFYWESPIPH
jgi:hypothetical protein